MRILTDAFVARYGGRLVNIHPSLLPAFPGLHTHRRALTAGVRIHGCTVHFVTPTVDGGPIIAQAAVPVAPDDTEETLAARVLAQEHRIYPQVVRWIWKTAHWRPDGRVTIGQTGAATGPRLPPFDAGLNAPARHCRIRFDSLGTVNGPPARSASRAGERSSRALGRRLWRRIRRRRPRRIRQLQPLRERRPRRVMKKPTMRRTRAIAS